MSSFQNKLERIFRFDLPIYEDTSLNQYAELSPDNLYGKPGSYTFIYDPDRNKLVGTDDTHIYHAYMITHYWRYGGKFNVEFDEYDEPANIRVKAIESGLILGRVGSFNNTRAVSVWNGPHDLANVQAAVQSLIKKKLLDETDLVIMYRTLAATVTKFLTGEEKQTESGWTAADMRMAHTAHPTLKWAILGGKRGGKKHPLAEPGRKWWAPTSEDTQ